MSAIRWILFLPAAVLGSLIASYLFRMGAFMFPEIIRLFACGSGGAVGMVVCGLYVAPRKTRAVKWILIVLAALLGFLSVLGSLLGKGDKLEAAIGIAMVLTAFAFIRVKPDEITENA